jgi:glutathione S-transferase
MITVHHLETSRSQRILWLLEELGLPYQLKIYQRDKRTRLAPPELKQIHPLGKSPVITDGQIVVAESGAIIEYLVETHAPLATGELAHLAPAVGTPAHRQCRFWMHYAEGSLMNWLVMKLVFASIPKQPMPFFVRPVAKALCATVQSKLIDPNVDTALDFMEDHLATHHWHKLILESLSALRNIIRDTDPQLFERYANDKNSPYLYLVKDPNVKADERAVIEKQWQSLAQRAIENKADFVLPVVPYNDSHIVGQHNGLFNGSVLYVD